MTTWRNRPARGTPPPGSFGAPAPPPAHKAPRPSALAYTNRRCGAGGESPAGSAGAAGYPDTVTRTACAVITKLYELCHANPIDDAELLPLIGGVATVVEQELRAAGLASADAAAARRRVEDFAVATYVDLCRRNDPDGADALEDAATCRRLMAGRRSPRTTACSYGR